MFCVILIQLFKSSLCLVSCGTLRSTDIAIHIVALVLSVMITLTSTTVILAVVLVVCPSKKCNPDEEVEYELEKVNVV